jgi:CheY-like chemotaxis protein
MLRDARRTLDAHHDPMNDTVRSHKHERGRKGRPAMSISHKTILIADDNTELRRTLSAIFAEEGYAVRQAPDGLAALAQIRNEIPDVLLSDLNMPRMSGFELISLVRRRYPGILVIAMSGTSNDLPSDVAADAFYNKGESSVMPLLHLVEAPARMTGQAPAGRPLPARHHDET